MIRPVRLLLLILSIAAAAVYLLDCGGSEVIALGGSEVIGKLVREDNTPVSGVQVQALVITPKDSSGVSGFDTIIERSAYSDVDGSFKLDSLKDGLYTLEVKYPNDSLIVPQITFRPDSNVRVDLKTIIMRVPGSISGTVVTSGLPSDAMVFCYIAGTSFISTVNLSSGQFTISGIPADTTYTVTISSNGFINKTIENIRVEPATVTLVPEVITLAVNPDGDVPVPANVTAQNDTLNGTITVKWSPAPVSDVSRYIVYLSEQTTFSEDTVSDTFFTKKVYTNDADSTPKTVSFQVAALDKDRNIGHRSTLDSLPTVPPIWLGFAISFTNGAPLSSADSVSVVVQFTGKLRTVVNAAWWLDEQSDVIVEHGVEHLVSGTDTLYWKKDSEKNLLGITLTDNAGSLWTASVDAQSFRPTDTWVEFVPLLEERRWAGACVVNGTIVVFGGCKDKSTLSGPIPTGLKTAEKYDPATPGSWTKIESMTYPRHSAAYTECNGKIYVFGGMSGTSSNQSIVETTVEEYNPLDNTWDVIDTVDQALIGASACSFNGKIIVSGGMTGDAASTIIQSSIQEFDPSQRTWRTIGQMTSPRLLHRSFVLGTDQLIILGGVKHNDDNELIAVPESEYFSPAGGAGTFPPFSLDNGCFRFGAAVFNSELVTFGGQKSGVLDADTLDTVDIFNIENASHSVGKPMPFKCQGMAVVTFNNGIYSIGGSVSSSSSHQNSTKAVYVYYP